VHGQSNVKLSSALILVAVRFKAWVCGHSLKLRVRSLQGHGYLSLVSVVCCQRSLHRADHLFRGVLLRVVLLNVIVKSEYFGSPGPIKAVAL
jgi:hypothetical protein